jgi:predicted neutral ceramidase superfamily lipid hydrolase
VSSGDLDRLLRIRAGTAASARFTRVVTLSRLELMSVIHSCIYTGLLVCAFVLHNPQPSTTILGLAHGIVWIAMSLVCIAAARFRVIPWWLAVCVAVLGGIGPFFGTGGFIIETRRRRRYPEGRTEPDATDR